MGSGIMTEMGIDFAAPDDGIDEECDGYGKVWEWRCMGCGKAIKWPTDCDSCSHGSYGRKGTWVPKGCLMILQEVAI